MSNNIYNEMMRDVSSDRFSSQARSNMMRTLILAATAALALSVGANLASAGDELDKNIGSGAYLHPIPTNGGK
ncbi:hypothetical protein [Hyphomicrobium sulfonivorans]|uniref:hypothetical protein n=1 Tax=Hyphomicrobium sulfonivorans TaxID=121290 RepID=UPI00156D430E|nr:hypothetical protein [Hyphomicrobium sulfonivorans]MBI1651362.1 hypothetical protein [Hyphomicrobium sulfonivorans]NSL73315.1 hypothetical protein [Hyphomicrobium sulfonivorans]